MSEIRWNAAPVTLAEMDVFVAIFRNNTVTPFKWPGAKGRFGKRRKASTSQ